MASKLTVDIETLPCTNEDLLDEIADGIQPPGNMKKAETIQEWEKNDKPRLVEQAILKTALDGTYGRVCCIAYAYEDSEPVGFIDRDEKKVLTSFFKDLESRMKQSKTPPTMLLAIGHAVADFDLRFLWQRCIIKSVKPFPYLPWHQRAWSEYIADTMAMWNPDKDKRVSLHKLCIALGIPSPKDEHGMTGADVYRLWLKRQYDPIREYGISDVVATRECYRKMTNFYG